MITFVDAEAESQDERRMAIKLATCSCGSLAWVVFQITGQRHLHLQCAQCSTSYCPNNECAPKAPC